MPTPKLTNVQRAVNAYLPLNEQERAEFDVAIKYYNLGLQRVQAEPEKRVGRPLGAKNKPKASVNGGAFETDLLTPGGIGVPPL